MKPALKVLLWVTAASITLVALGWGGGILYWHLRIRSAIRSWEKNGRPLHYLRGSNFGMSYEDSRLLHAAGCRMLPYLVSAFDASEDPEFQEALIANIICLLSGPGPYTDESMHVLGERVSRWEFIASNLELERKAKSDDFKEWWRRHGAEYHRWWRFWSSWCAGE